MYTPDRNIVRKIREYDPHLFVLWNNQFGYFEIWRHMTLGRKLITPVTQSIFIQGASKTYHPLDERILPKLFNADSHRWRSSREYAKFQDDAWKKEVLTNDRKQHERNKDKAKEIYSLITNFYTTKHASKNNKHPNLNKKPKNAWIRPDVQAWNSPNLFSRSAANALRYGFKK